MRSLYRGADGAIVATERLDSASDFSELDDVSAEGRKIVVTETYIDAPCDGTDKHRYKKLRRETSIAPDPAAPDLLRVKTSDTTRNTQPELSAERSWIRVLQSGYTAISLSLMRANP